TRADGTPLSDRPVRASLTIDGTGYGPDGKQSLKPTLSRTDAQGRVILRFRLPQQIERGEALLAVTFEDGPVVESVVRPVPLVLRKLQVEFFPEGGDLLVGVP